MFLCSSSARPLGRRARRRRVVNCSIALFLALLMLIGPENVYALSAEAMLYRSLAGVVLTDVTSGHSDYSYDANGNLTAITAGGQANTYVYDAAHRLVRATTGIGASASSVVYTYDADGVRTGRTTLRLGGTERVRYLTDKQGGLSHVLAELDAAGVLVVRYTHGDDLISQRRGSVTRYYHYDGQQSTRMLTNDPADPAADPAAVTDSYTYDAFGNVLLDSDATPNVYRYTGEELDTDTGMYHLRARYYQPTTGRFTSRDPFGGVSSDPASLHKYLYAGADPVNCIDPSGREFTLASINLRSSFVMVLALALFGTAYSVRALRPATNHHQDDIIQVHVDVVLVLPDKGMSDLNTGHRLRMVARGMDGATAYWKHWAGIELIWGPARNVRNSDLYTLKTSADVEAALRQFHNNRPLVVAVYGVETQSAEGVLALTIAPYGFAVDAQGSEGTVYAHEFGHLFIPRMLSHSFWATHVQGNPSNLMTDGEDRVGDINTLFMTQRQVDAARQRIREQKWGQ